MTFLVIIIAMACSIGVAALAGAVWSAAEELYFGPLARRMRGVRQTEPSAVTFQDLLREAPAIPRDDAGTRGRGAKLWTLPALWIAIVLEQAQTRLSLRRLLTFSIAGGMALATAGAILRLPIFLWPTMGLLPVTSAVAWILFRRRRRIRRIQEDLPATFDTVANAMKAGQSLPAALQSAAETTPAPLKDELVLLCDGLYLGAPLDHLLDDLTRRVPCPEVKFFVAALRMWRRSGGNLAEILGAVSTMLRERLQLNQQVRALSAEGRLSGLVLIALPFLAFIAVLMTTPDYLAALVNDELGRRMVTIAALLQLAGAVIIQRMVNFNP